MYSLKIEKSMITQHKQTFECIAFVLILVALYRHSQLNYRVIFGIAYVIILKKISYPIINRFRFIVFLKNRTKKEGLY